MTDKQVFDKNRCLWTWSSEYRTWVDGDGNRASPEDCIEFDALHRKHQIRMRVENLHDADLLFSRMRHDGERAAAIRWLITTYGLGGKI